MYIIIIVPVFLYGRETWSLTLKEKHRLRVFENRVLRRMFGPKYDEVTGELRKLHNEELHLLVLKPKYHYGRGVYKVLLGKPKGKRPHERQWRRWEDGLSMELLEMGWGI